jgi:IK cytokine
MKIIEESKYLGGDLEHTHLVKGLDYALLQKVKAEIEKKESELDDEERNEVDEEQEDLEEEDKPQNKSKLALKSSTAAIAAAYNRSMQDSSEIKM